jgi:hypothetical protein
MRGLGTSGYSCGMQQVHNGSIEPPVALQDAVRAALRNEGEVRVVERTGLSRFALLKLAGGQPVRRGTAALAAVVLDLGLEVLASVVNTKVIGGSGDA